LRKDEKFYVRNEVFFFLPVDEAPVPTTGSGLQERMQNALKAYGKLYYLLIKIFSPVFVSPFSQKKIRKIMNAYGENSIILNLGSGPTYFLGRKDIINVDLFPFREVDIVADVGALPIEDRSLDLIINIAMLEHVADPKCVIGEMYRILKGGGRIICYLPFIVPFHVAPNDFQRWTIAGIKNLFSSFHHLEVSIGGGPTSGMLWVFQEWLSLLLSFGNRTVHDILFLCLMVFTVPLKLLDAFMVKLPYADRVASGFYVFGEKATVEK
jgi:SAM-dependent methyltransferase